MWKFASHHIDSNPTLSLSNANSQLASHGNRVFEAINAVVNSLDKQGSLNGLLEELGTRHVTYGVKAEYLPVTINF